MLSEMTKKLYMSLRSEFRATIHEIITTQKPTRLLGIGGAISLRHRSIPEFDLHCETANFKDYSAKTGTKWLSPPNNLDLEV